MNKAQAINSEIRPGDWVIVTPNNEYGCLIGQVTEITPLGSPEHDTGTLTDDIHVNFVDVAYSDERKAEIVEQIGDWHSIQTLDDVLMATDSLIRISGAEISDVEYATFEELLESRDAAQTYCNQLLGSLYNEKVTQLTERLDANLADYHASLMDFGKQEIIDMAAKIVAMTDSHDYLTTTFGFDEGNIDYLLQFQNPLEVVADEWRRRTEDTSDMSFAVYEVFDKQDALQGGYALMSDAPARTDLRRFMGVDLIDFLGKIAEKTIIHYPNDWNVDIDELYKAAVSHDPEDKRLMWHVCSVGTHIRNERDVFIKDSGPFGYWTDYHQNDPDMFGYAVEVTGRNGLIVTGNVFEVGNYAEHAKYVRETALPLSDVTLTYSDNWGVNAGKTITVSRSEYDNERNRLMSKSGNVVGLRWHPAEEAELTELLRRERSARMSLPLGSMEAHVSRLTEKLSEVRTPPEPPMPKRKQSLEEQLRAAGERVKAQDAQQNKAPHKRAERC